MKEIYLRSQHGCPAGKPENPGRWLVLGADKDTYLKDTFLCAVHFDTSLFKLVYSVSPALLIPVFPMETWWNNRRVPGGRIYY